MLASERRTPEQCGGSPAAARAISLSGLGAAVLRRTEEGRHFALGLDVGRHHAAVGRGTACGLPLRRFTALGIDPSTATGKKDKTDWGPEPIGTRTELLGDIKFILQKAIDDIDNVAERPDLMVTDVTERKPKTFKEVFPLAVKNLAAAAARYKPLLQAEGARTTDRVQTGIIANIIELCDEITASVAKLPAK